MSDHGRTNPITPELTAQLIENAQIVIPEDGVYHKLKSSQETDTQLRIKMGFDPTSPDLHLGHAVSMKQMRRFQDLGHLPVIIVGDFTGRIGDPSGRNESRPLVDADELAKNAETYIEQLAKVLDTDNIEVRYNSEWLEAMSLTDTINLLAQATLSQTITRDDFRNRLQENQPIALHEIIYPYLQGMDSIAVKADIEIGGVDQLYAFQAARTLQENAGEEPEALVLMPLLRGLDGVKKMSKSVGNYVGLQDAPEDMFGKVMSIPDSLIEDYLRLASSFDDAQIAENIEAAKNGKDAMRVKMDLAQNITATYHDEEAATQARAHFDRHFRSKDISKQDYIPVEVTADDTIIEVILKANAAGSKSQARRLIESGGVRVNGEKISLEQVADIAIINGLKIRVGKKCFIKTSI